MDEKNPYAVNAPSSPRRRGPFFVRSDWWVFALLLLAGPLFGTLAAMGPAVGHLRMAAMFGVTFGLPVGVVMLPFIFLLVRARPPWLVAIGTLAPGAFAAWIGGTAMSHGPSGSPLVSLLLTAYVYLGSAALVCVGVPRTKSLGACPHCGYALAGLTSDVCPECGEKFGECC